MRALTVSIKMLDAAIKHYKTSDEQLDSLFRRHGVPRQLLGQPGARVSAENYSALLQDIMVAMKDELLGYGTAPQRLGTWKIMSLSVITADTLGEALRRYCTFFNLFDWGLSPRLTLEDGMAVLTLTPSPTAPELEAYGYVATLFYYQRFASWLVDRQIPIVKLELNFPPPPYADEFRPMFLYCPVSFNAARSRIYFSEAMLSLPLQQDALSLSEFMRNPNLVMISREYSHSSWHSRIRALVARDLTDIPTFNDIASRLDIHPQTLRRQLANEGLSYSEIKNQARRDAAIYHLSRSRLPVEEIAYLTGFAEPSNFIRAFKQWTGVTPLTYRKM